MPGNRSNQSDEQAAAEGGRTSNILIIGYQQSTWYPGFLPNYFRNLGVSWRKEGRLIRGKVLLKISFFLFEITVRGGNSTTQPIRILPIQARAQPLRTSARVRHNIIINTSRDLSRVYLYIYLLI